MVSGVGAANASGAKENCEERSIQQNLCDEYQPVAESGAAASVSVDTSHSFYDFIFTILCIL